MEPINVLVSTFTGLSLPSTICIPVSGDLSTTDLLQLITKFLPDEAVSCSYFTTNNNRKVVSSAHTTVSDLATWTQCRPCPSECAATRFLPLRLIAPLVGGKGGFGSQLRAAGGRMSVRKRRQNAELAAGSARNLDGRRLRTITEAKNLATYLATKPDMDRKEKEARRKRWEAVVELAEQKEADMRAGKTPDGRKKGLSSEWIEEKEEVGENVKNAVKTAMAVDADHEDNGGSSGSNASHDHSADEDSDEDPMELGEADMTKLRKEAEAGDTDAIWVLQNKLRIPQSLLPKPQKQQRRFAGFDDEDEDTSSSDEDDQGRTISKEKGKAVVCEP